MRPEKLRQLGSGPGQPRTQCPGDHNDHRPPARLVVRDRRAISHPRVPGATSRTAAREIEAPLHEAGYSNARTETLHLNPPLVCVLAVNEPSTHAGRPT